MRELVTSTRSCQGGPKPSHPLGIGEDEQPPPHPHSPAARVSFFAAFIRLQIAFFFFFSSPKINAVDGSGFAAAAMRGRLGEDKDGVLGYPDPLPGAGTN